MFDNKSFLFFLLLINFFWGAKNDDEKNIKIISDTFKYGTFEQQLETLKKFNPNVLALKTNPKYFETLQILYNNLDNDSVAMKLLTIVHSYKIKKYYPWFNVIIKRAAEKKDPLKPETKSLISEGLRLLRSFSNMSDVNLISSFYDNKKLNHEDPNIIAESILGIASFKTLNTLPRLREIYNETSYSSVKRAIIKAVASYKKKEDINFLERIIFSDTEGNIQKWIAVVSLKEFAPSTKALNLLKECYASDDFEIKSRALYTLSFFNAKEMRPIIIKATKNSSVNLRLQAIRALEQYTDDEINDLLMFKYKYDKEPSIKKAAGIILKKRGLIKDEEKKDSKEPKKSQVKEKSHKNIDVSKVRSRVKSKKSPKKSSPPKQQSKSKSDSTSLDSW